MATKKGTSRPNPVTRFSLEERRRVFEDGVPLLLPSGVDVLLRPVTPGDLLRSGNIPDTLTPLLADMLFEKDFNKTNNAVDAFVQSPREKIEQAVEMLAAIDMVCEAALIDPEQLPYLTHADRAFVFRMAFLPAEVLSRFRAIKERDVESVDQGDEVRRAA